MKRSLNCEDSADGADSASPRPSAAHDCVTETQGPAASACSTHMLLAHPQSDSSTGAAMRSEGTSQTVSAASAASGSAGGSVEGTALDSGAAICSGGAPSSGPTPQGRRRTGRRAVSYKLRAAMGGFLIMGAAKTGTFGNW
mgnify:CR=1 FL=1